MTFPLKADFFPQVRLTSEEQRRYVAIGEHNARALRSSMKTLDWKTIMDKDGVTYAQAHCIEGSDFNFPFTTASKADDKPETTASVCLMVSATAFAAGTVSETIKVLASPVTEDYRRTMHFLHGSYFVDGICVHTIEGTELDSVLDKTKSNSRAFTTIKWAAFDDGMAFNVAESPSDYCFLEHSGVHHNTSEDSEADLFGFSIQESMTREREVPSLAGLGLVRGHLHRTGVLVLPTDRSDVVQITSILQMRMAKSVASNSSGVSSGFGKVTELDLTRQMCRRVSVVGRLDLLLERRRLNKLKHVPRVDWVSDDARKTCAVCVRPFALRRRKHHCRHCGEVVCSSCAPAREVDLDIATTSNVRICTACVIQSRSGTQGPGCQNVSVYHVSNTSAPQSSTDSTQSHKCGTQTKSLSTRPTHADGCSIDSSSASDTHDSLTSSLLSNQKETNRHHMRCNRNSQRKGRDRADACSAQLTCTSNLVNSDATSDLFERIRGMKADLFTLITSYQHFQEASDYSPDSSTANSFVDEEFAKFGTSTMPVSYRLKAEGAPREDKRRWRTRSRNAEGFEGAMDVDYISDSEQFTLLCPQTLSRQWHARTSSQAQQDAGEKSRFSASLSNTSFVSTLSDSIILGDDENHEQHEESQEFKDVVTSQNQVELQTLRQQVEELHRLLAAATSQLDSLCTRGAHLGPMDPVATRHQVNCRLLVKDLHELMGLPCPTGALE